MFVTLSSFFAKSSEMSLVNEIKQKETKSGRQDLQKLVLKNRMDHEFLCSDPER